MEVKIINKTVIANEADLVKVKTKLLPIAVKRVKSICIDTGIV